MSYQERLVATLRDRAAKAKMQGDQANQRAQIAEHRLAIEREDNARLTDLLSRFMAGAGRRDVIDC